MKRQKGVSQNSYFVSETAVELLGSEKSLQQGKATLSLRS
jgi:hypothetical protein